MVDWFQAHPALAQTLGAASAKTAGYVPFFVLTALLGLPAVVLVLYLSRRGTARLKPA